MTNLRDDNKTACREVKTQGLRGVAGVNRLQTIAGMYHVTENRRELAITSQTHMCYMLVQGAGTPTLMHVIVTHSRVQPPLVFNHSVHALSTYM